MSNPLRVGVIGCGGIAQIMHLHFLYTQPELFSLRALSDISPGVLRAMGERYHVSESARFARYQDLVAQELDVVMVLTGGNHYAQIIAALQAGKHVFSEKPLCYSTHEADEIVRVAQSVKRKVMVGYMKRYDPGYQYAQARLQEMS